MTLHEVQSFPTQPQLDAEYVFARMPRQAVTGSNHGMHKYPAKFVPQIPAWALSYMGGEKLSVVDPFCGSGTTQLEAALAGHVAYGFDVSPLAVIISNAKTWVPTIHASEVDGVVGKTVARGCEIAKDVSPEIDQELHGLHHTWDYWFAPDAMAALLGLRYAIEELWQDSQPELANFLRASLSAIVKRASYLSENQIKVRLDPQKTPELPTIAFSAHASSSLQTQLTVGQEIVNARGSGCAKKASAVDLPLESDSVDCVITSPPYINAVDYTMAHKYSLFVLGLLEPTEFKEHCREYVGLTERAVRKGDCASQFKLGTSSAERAVKNLSDLNTALGRNRAYVVAQYFDGMARSLAESHRILKPGGRLFLVLGTSNRICGMTIETARIVEDQALALGFHKEVRFFHRLANRSSMRLNRSSTGGALGTESVYVFSK